MTSKCSWDKSSILLFLLWFELLLFIPKEHPPPHHPPPNTPKPFTHTLLNWEETNFIIKLPSTFRKETCKSHYLHCMFIPIFICKEKEFFFQWGFSVFKKKIDIQWFSIKIICNFSEFGQGRHWSCKYTTRTEPAQTDLYERSSEKRKATYNQKVL